MAIDPEPRDPDACPKRWTVIGRSIMAQADRMTTQLGGRLSKPPTPMNGTTWESPA